MQTVSCLPPPLLPVFLSFMTLFVYVHSGWKSQSQEDAARNGAAPPPPPLRLPRSFLCVFLFLSRAETQQPGARSGFPSELTVSLLCMSVYVGKEQGGGGGGEVVRRGGVPGE